MIFSKMDTGSVFYLILIYSFIYLVNSKKPYEKSGSLLRRRRLIKGNVDIKKEELYGHDKLPVDIDPIHYDLEIKIIFDSDLQIEGKVKIELKCIKSTKTIIMNAENLQIKNTTMKVTLKDNPSKELNIINIDQNEISSLLTIILDQQLQVNNYYLVSMDFFKNNASCFLESYENDEVVENDNEDDDDEDDIKEEDEEEEENGEVKKEISFLRIPNSQNGARELFPCYDESCKTSTFSLVIVRPSDMVSVSSSNLLYKEVIDNEWTADHYNKTEEIEPSCLAIVISNMVYRETLSKRKVKIRVWAPPSYINETQFIAYMAPNALDELEKYFNNFLPLDELNFFPVPNLGFAGQASLGTLFIEWDNYFPNEFTTREDVLDLLDTIIHEISHQWFLILLSISKDNELWTGEGFATFIAQKLTNILRPDSKDDGTFILTRFQIGLAADESPYVLPLTLNLENMTESEADSALSNNTFIYDKGSSVFYMLENHLGEDNFCKRIQAYINKTLASHLCIENDKLWSTIGEGFPDMNISHIFNSWTLQPGFPVVSIFRDYENNQTNISQCRFLKLANTSMAPVDSNTWDIPLMYTSMHERNWAKPKLFWLTENNITSKEIFAPKNEWLIFNIKYTGFYRVNYDSHNWDLIIEQLKNDPQSFALPETRAAIIDDAFHLAEHGLLDYERLLNIAHSLSKEKAYLPWKTLIDNLQILTYRVEDKCSLRRLFRLISKLVKPSYEEYGWHWYDEQSLERMKSYIVVDLMCKLGYKDCVSESLQQFKKYVINETTFNMSGFTSIIICTQVRFGNFSKFKSIIKDLYNNNNKTIPEEIVSGYFCLRKYEDLKRFIEPFLNSNESIGPFMGILFENPAGSSLLYSYLTSRSVVNNCSELLSFDFFSLMKLRWRTDEELKVVETLIDLCSEDGVVPLAFKSLLNEVKFNNQWLKKYGDDIGLILQKFDNSETTCKNLDIDLQIEMQ